MSDETNRELPRLTAAWNELDKLCKGERKFTMSIPVQPTDSDIVIGDALRFAQEEIGELKAKLTQAKEALKLCLPIVQNDVCDLDSAGTVCYYCGEVIDSGDEHKDDCKQLAAYLAAKSVLEIK